MNDVELAETMTSRPAAPDSETPETDAENATSPENGPVSPQCYSRAIALARSLERRLSIAQTEIKGHMMVEDELRAEIARLQQRLTRFNEERERQTTRADEAQARIAELEKDRDSWKREAEMMANAWQRELCDHGILYRPKTHWIDFMVLATRKVMALAKENGVSCCDQPELCAKTDCNNLLRYRLATLKDRT